MPEQVLDCHTDFWRPHGVTGLSQNLNDGTLHHTVAQSPPRFASDELRWGWLREAGIALQNVEHHFEA